MKEIKEDLNRRRDTQHSQIGKLNIAKNVNSFQFEYLDSKNNLLRLNKQTEHSTTS